MQRPLSTLQIEEAKTFKRAKNAKCQEQSNYLYGLKYILETIGGGG